MIRDRLPPVYLLTGEFPPRMGGIADYTARLAEHLLELDLEVTVLVGADHPLQSAAVPVERLDASLKSWSMPRAVARRIGSGEAIVHIQFQTAAFGMHPAIHALPAWLRWRRPLARSVVTCHDVRAPYLFPKAGPVREWAVHRLIDMCHAAIFSDAGDRAWAGRQTHHALIPIGSGIPRIAVEPRVLEHAGPFRLGYFGFMNASKGLDTLFRAMQILLSDKRDVRLVLIGDALGDADATNMQTRQALDAEIARLGLTNALERTGPLSSEGVSLALQACDALAFPFDDGATYRRSSLSAALVHARPIVTTLRPDGSNGIPEFTDGRSVLLVRPRDAAQMAHAIASLIDDPGLRERLAEGARSDSACLQWPSIAAAVRAVYASVCQPVPSGVAA